MRGAYSSFCNRLKLRLVPYCLPGWGAWRLRDANIKGWNDESDQVGTFCVLKTSNGCNLLQICVEPPVFNFANHGMMRSTSMHFKHRMWQTHWICSPMLCCKCDSQREGPAAMGQGGLQVLVLQCQFQTWNSVTVATQSQRGVISTESQAGHEGGRAGPPPGPGPSRRRGGFSVSESCHKLNKLPVTVTLTVVTRDVTLSDESSRRDQENLGCWPNYWELEPHLGFRLTPLRGVTWGAGLGQHFTARMMMMMYYWGEL